MSSSKASSAARWFSGWRRGSRPRQPDFADFGTAFGLDLSLAQPLPADAAPPMPAATGWRLRLKRLRRLKRRRSD